MLEVNYIFTKVAILLRSPTTPRASFVFREAGALEALVATMKAHPDDPRLQSWSAYAAQRISSGDDAAGLKRQKKAKEARTNVDDI